MPRPCVICGDSRKSDFVARRHLEGHSLSTMERLSREAGMPIKRETIQKHLLTCLATPTDVRPAQVAKMAEAMHKSDPGEDVAVLVQREVVKKLREGEARVTVQHGLQAQALLDRRAERAKDRELAITLTRLLHGGAPPAALVQARRVDAEIIDGEAIEVIG